MSKRTSNERNWEMIMAVIAVVIIGIHIFSFVFFPLVPWMEEREAGQEVVEETYDSDNAVQQYEDFRRMYHDIQAQREQIQNSYEEHDQFHETYGDDPNEWSRTAETRHGRIHERITGNKDILADQVAEYNAESDMANRELYKCNLPFQVDDRFAITGPPGSEAPDEPVDTDPDGNPIEGEVPPAEECDGLPDKINT